MKKLLTILLILFSLSSFAQFDAGEFVNSDTVKINGVPLLLNTFKEGNLGGASNIFYSTGASSQPASGSVNQVIGGNSLTANYVPKWDGSKLGNSSISDNGTFVSTNLPFSSSHSLSAPTHFAGTSFWNSNFFELGYGQTGNRYTAIDFTSDDTYSDYGLRIIRLNTGPNAISQLLHRGKGGFYLGAQDAASFYFYTKNTTALTIDTLQNVGVGILTPAARMHSQSTGTQLRLGYDATKYTDLSTGSTGNLTIDPTGDTTKIVGAVNSTGGFFKNGVEITGGTGSMVYPINSGIVQFNGTTWGTSITNNSSLWNNAYDKKIVSAAFSGTSTKTLTLYQQDGNVLQAAFTDEGGSYTLPTASTSTLGGVKVDGSTVTINGSGVISTSGTSKWTADTYGIKYQSGNVGIKVASDNNTGLSVGDGTQSDVAIAAKSNSGYAVDAATTNSSAIRAFSVNNNGVYAISTNDVAVFGVSTYGYGGDFTGLGCRATKFYVSSLNTAPASSTATGTTGEIRICSTGIYICIATNTWIRQLFSTW